MQRPLLAGLGAVLLGLAPALAQSQDQDPGPDPQAKEEAVAETAPVVAFADPDRFTAREGEALYRSICQGCHMPDGRGAVGAAAYPALAENENLAFPDYPVNMVLYGQNAMPPFGAYLDDEQVAAVVGYVQTHLGNDYAQDQATADLVAEIRAQ